MNSSLKPGQRLAVFPKALGVCASEATIYAKCVATKGDLRQDMCHKEFQAFRACMKQAINKLKR